MKITLKEADIQQAVFEYLKNRVRELSGDPDEIVIFWDESSGLTAEIDIEDADQNSEPSPQ